MDKTFKKYFWVGQALVLVLVAFLLAGAVNSFLASFMVGYTIAVPETDTDAIAAAASAADDPWANVVSLNPDAFPSEENLDDGPEDPCEGQVCDDGLVCDPTTGACVPDPEADEGPIRDDGRCLESDIAINLVGTMVSEEDEWSIAILHNPSTEKTEFAMIGDTLLAQAQVTSIHRNRVMLVRNGATECLRPGDQSERSQRRQAQGESATPTQPATPDTGSTESANTVEAATPTPPRGQTLNERIEAGVTSTGRGNYDIDRAVLNEVLEDPAALERQAPDVVPNYQNGQPRGYRLQGISSGSIFSAIGIRNGDVIVSVNGQTIDSPQRAMSLYESMLSQQNVALVVERRGREQTLSYNIE